MIELTIEKIIDDQPDIQSIGLLASTAVLITGLFKKACDHRGIHLIYPSDDLQKDVLKSIKMVKAGTYGKQHIQNVQRASDYLLQQNAEAIIIGCTELSVLSNELLFEVKIYDSSQVLAENVVKIVKYKN